jgi:putative transposase
VRRRYRKREEWRSLIEQQEASGESVTAFCRRHDISTKSFWHQRKALGESPVQNAMIAVEPPVRTNGRAGQAMLSWRGIDLTVSLSASPAWVAQLMRELADASVS